MDHVEAEEWEGWTRDIVEPEVAGFTERARALRGLTERALRSEIGEPDQQVAPGAGQWSESGELIFQSDADLRYFGLLAHTCVNISMKDGLVAGIGYFPKWKRCPLDRVAALGDAFAPT